MNTARKKIEQLELRSRSTASFRISFRALFLKKHVLPFTRNLYSLLNARISITRALELLNEQETHPSFRKIITEIRKSIGAGKSFYQALSFYPELFDPFYLNMVEMGEAIGKLDESLFHILEYKERIRDIRRKFFQMMSYPVLVILIATGAIAFLLTNVVPAFADMFRDFDAELPLITQIVMTLSEFIRHYLILFLLIFLLFIIAIVFTLQTEKGKKLLDFMLLKIPGWKYFYRHNLILNFSLSMGTLLSNGIPLVKALEIVQKNTTNRIMSEEIQKIHFLLNHGHSLKTSLRHSRIFPPMIAGIFEIGEETARLDSMMLHIAKLYQQETDHFLSQLVAFLEPAIIIFLGIVIGGILISMYLPLFELSNVIQ